MTEEPWPPHHQVVRANFDNRAEVYDQSRMHRWLAQRMAELLGPTAA
ncbi:MAG: hypothetical protein H0V41_17800 [Pseudonocardiales bacterium]|nr:hypothetical protein [Pseudonocardiales bacterium]